MAKHIFKNNIQHNTWKPASELPLELKRLAYRDKLRDSYQILGNISTGYIPLRMYKEQYLNHLHTDSSCPDVVQLLHFTHLQDEEAAAAPEAQDVTHPDATVGAGRDPHFVEEGAVGAVQVVDIQAGFGALRRQGLFPFRGAPWRPALKHGVVP